MKYEKEVTVLVEYSKDELYSILEKNGFKICEEYDVKDIYMVDTNYKDISKPLKMLEHSILIRNVIATEEKKLVTYKFKEYNEKEEIIRQGKVSMEIKNTEDAIKIFQCLKYEHLVNVNDHVVIFNNGIDEFAVEFVNDKHIYIEVEDKCNYCDTVYNSVDEMKDLFKKYNITKIKNDNYFAKKAKDAIIEKYEI